MSKKPIVDALEGDFPSRAAAERAVDKVFDTIRSTVGAGEPVVIRGFGTFKKQDRAGRVGRNPRTGEPVNIAASSKFVMKSKVTF